MGAISEIQLGEGSGRLHGANPRGASALVLHIHGGAFTCGSPNESDGMAKLLAEAGATVFSAAYPLAPHGCDARSQGSVASTLGFDCGRDHR